MDISAGVSTTSTEPMIASTEQIFSAVAWLIYWDEDDAADVTDHNAYRSNPGIHCCIFQMKAGGIIY